MKNKLIVVVAVLVGILAFWLSVTYLDREYKKIYADSKEVVVIAAAADLPAGTVLQRNDIGVMKLFEKAVGNDVFLAADADKVIGKKLKESIRKNSPLRWSQLDMPRPGQAGLAPIIKKRSRAISISISGSAAVSGLVKPNDHVDILGTFTFPSRVNPQQVESVTLTLMQNVTVLATGQTLARQTTESGGEAQQGNYSSVTFEVSPREAEILVFAQQTRGQLYLALRNPDDIYSETELPSVNFDYLETVLTELNQKRQMEIRRDPQVE